MVAGDGALPAAVREDVLLLVSELVTNAVRQVGDDSGQSLRVDLRFWPRRVRVGVVDQRTRVRPVRARLQRDELGGHGLFLVDQIADRWGVSHTASGTCVWFEIEFAG
ncbi:MAG: ATP-binding protein [Thermoleophilaceae bacterium]|nr:ATP-binding protein [Thermoleophilaceae bacterium]